jgi:hypothetical protein
MLLCCLLVLGAAGPLGLALAPFPTLADVYAAISILTLDTRALRLACNGGAADFAGQFWTLLVANAVILLPAMLVVAMIILAVKVMRSAGVVGVSVHELMPLLSDRLLALIGGWIELSAMVLMRAAFEALGCVPIDSQMRLAAQLSLKCYEGSHLSIVAVAVILLVLLMGVWPGLVAYRMLRARRFADPTAPTFVNRWGYVTGGLRANRLLFFLFGSLVRVCVSISGVAVHWPLARLLVIVIPTLGAMAADLFGSAWRKKSGLFVHILALAFVIVAAVLHYMMATGATSQQDTLAIIVLALVGIVVLLHLALALEFIVEFIESNGAVGLLKVWFVDNSSWPSASAPFLPWWAHDKVVPISKADEVGDELNEADGEADAGVYSSPQRTKNKRGTVLAAPLLSKGASKGSEYHTDSDGEDDDELDFEDEASELSGDEPDELEELGDADGSEASDAPAAGLPISFFEIHAKAAQKLEAMRNAGLEITDLTSGRVSRSPDSRTSSASTSDMDPDLPLLRSRLPRLLGPIALVREEDEGDEPEEIALEEPPKPASRASRMPPIIGWGTGGSRGSSASSANSSGSFVSPLSTSLDDISPLSTTSSDDEGPIEEGLDDVMLEDLRRSTSPLEIPRYSTSPLALAGSETILQTEGFADELNVARGKEHDPFAFADVPAPRSGLENGNEPTTALPRLSVFDTSVLEESDEEYSSRIQLEANEEAFNAALFSDADENVHEQGRTIY